MGFFGSTCWAILGGFDLRSMRKELRAINYKKDLGFGINLLDDMPNLTKARKKEIVKKLERIEGVLLDCRSCMKDTNPNSSLNRHLGTVNMWTMNVENDPNYSHTDFKKAMRSVRSYMVSETKI